MDYIKNLDMVIGVWVNFNPENRETHPPSFDKYLVCRKDGKMHMETWNGTGWAYNHNSIKYWGKIYLPEDILTLTINSNNER